MAPPDPLIGYTLAGKYRIQTFVTEEALGRVYSALVLNSDQRVTVKVLHPHLIEDPEVFGRFAREMIATAAVEHPNTITMLDFGEHRVFHYIVMEELSVTSLERVLLDVGRMTWERVAHIGAQVADAMDAAHRENITHRNLSSRNVLLLNNARGDYVKIRDFGLSRLSDDQGNDEVGGLTAVGARVGTTAYMAPEYIEEARVDPRGDIYSLGILMFELLTGQPPFTGKAGLVMEAHISDPPPVPSEVAEGCPRWLSDLILQMLAKTPEERPATGAEVRKRLEKGVGKSLKPPETIALTRENEVEIIAEMEKRRKQAEANLARAGAAAAGGLVLTLLVAGLGVAVLVGLVVVYLQMM